MSQDLHFCQLKGFDEKLIKILGFESTIKMLVAALEKKNFENNEDLQELLFESIDNDLPVISAYEKNVKPFLQGKSNTLLHKDSRYYLVNDEFWKCIKDIIFQNIKTDSNNKIEQLYENYLKDLAILEHYQKKNMLVVDAS